MPRNTATLAKLLALWFVCGLLTYLGLDSAELIGPHDAGPALTRPVVSRPVENRPLDPRPVAPVPVVDRPVVDKPAATAPQPRASPPADVVKTPAQDSKDIAEPAAAPTEPPGEPTTKAAVAGDARPAEPKPAAAPLPELDPARSPLPFLEVAFQGPPDRPAGLTQAELTRWLAPIPSADNRFFSETRENTPVAGFEGLVQLRHKWPEQGVLRCAPFAHDDGLAIHFWRGDEGVALYVYKNPRPAWAAYRTTRPRDRIRPSTHVLLSTDDGRYERTLPGAVEIRVQEGELVLSRGDLRLLSVPFPQLPSEVNFAHKALFSELTMYRSTPIPVQPEPATSDLLPSAPGAGLTWKIELPEGASFARDPKGALVLSRGKDVGTVRTHTRIPRTGLYEVLVEFDEVSAGTGVYLGDDTGQPRHVLGFRRDRTTRQPILTWMEPDVARFEADEDVRANPVPFGGPGQWLKIVAGCGTVRCAVSGDGRNWSRLLEPRRKPHEVSTHFGVIAFAMPTATRLGLRTVRVRELAGVKGLADAALIERVPADIYQTARPFFSWCGAVLASQPPDVDARAWRMACAVRTLSDGRTAESSNRILIGLVRDSLDGAALPEEKLRALDQAALAFDGWEPSDADQFLLCYDRIGRDLADRGLPQPYTLPAKSFRASPLWCSVPFQAVPEHLVKAELVGLLARDDWPAVMDLCSSLRFWNTTGEPGKAWPTHRSRIRGLVDRMERLGRDRLGISPPEDDPAATPATAPAPHPVVIGDGGAELSPLVELQSALVSGRYDDAARMLNEIRIDRAFGWLADPVDKNLYRSLSQWLVDSARQHPEWRKVMTARYGAAGATRVEQAIGRGDPADIESAALQLYGTSAAVSAHRWLGDRALLAGKPAEALGHYRLGRAIAEAESADEMALRERVATTLLASPPGKPRASGLTAERGVIPTASLQGLLDGLPPREEGKKGVGPVNGIAPVAWQAQQRHEWSGTTGAPPGLDVRTIDWSARQLACVRAGDLLFAANRRQIACYDLKTEKRLWIRVLDAALAAHPWPLLALRPAVTPERVYLRRPRKTGLGLVAVTVADGKIAWESDSQQIACSDPLFISGRLYCFTTTSEADAEMRRLSLAVLDPESGRTLSEAPVLMLHSSADRIPSCEAVLADTRIVGSIAGAIVCCDLEGKPQWLRRQTYLPAAETAFAADQEYSLPVVAGTRVVVMQPGVLELCCLDAASGQALWRYPLSNGRRPLGADASQIYIETSTDIRALALDDGRFVWEHPVAQMLDAFHLGDDGSLLYTQREPLVTKGHRPQLVWLETRTGRETAVWPLSELKDGFPVMGPLVRHGRNLWTFFGRGPNGIPRSLWKLSPVEGAAHPAFTDPQGIERWTSIADSTQEQIAAARLFPHWSQLGGIDDPDAGFRAEVHGQSDVLATRAGPGLPLVFTRELSVNSGGRPKLIVTAGHESSEAWTLRIFAGGRPLLTEAVDASRTRQHWKTWEVDLSPFAGQRIQLVVEQHAPDREAWAFWKQLEVVP